VRDASGSLRCLSMRGWRRIAQVCAVEPPGTETRQVAEAALSNLSQHPRNRTRLYRHELSYKAATLKESMAAQGLLEGGGDADDEGCFSTQGMGSHPATARTSASGVERGGLSTRGGGDPNVRALERERPRAKPTAAATQFTAWATASFGEEVSQPHPSPRAQQRNLGGEGSITRDAVMRCCIRCRRTRLPSLRTRVHTWPGADRDEGEGAAFLRKAMDVEGRNAKVVPTGPIDPYRARSERIAQRKARKVARRAEKKAAKAAAKAAEKAAQAAKAAPPMVCRVPPFDSTCPSLSRAVHPSREMCLLPEERVQAKSPSLTIHSPSVVTGGCRGRCVWPQASSRPSTVNGGPRAVSTAATASRPGTAGVPMTHLRHKLTQPLGRTWEELGTACSASASAATTSRPSTSTWTVNSRPFTATDQGFSRPATTVGAARPSTVGKGPSRPQTTDLSSRAPLRYAISASLAALTVFFGWRVKQAVVG
jgi:hypothetical protein